jgi:hypothetical protein
MPGWFSRLTQGGEKSGTQPVEFSVSCGCGNTLSGIRNRRMQVVVCRKCASQLCVLPASPYPRPKVRVPQKQSVKPKLAPLLELDEDGDESVAPAPKPRRSGSKVTPKPANKLAKSASKSAFQPPSKDRPKPRKPVSDEFLPSLPRAKIITPLRLMSAGMICLIFIAGWWTMHRRAVHLAGLTFADTARAGKSAMAQSDYYTADQQLRKAVEALDLLGREDREARQIRQLSREASVANGLSNLSLFELISESRQSNSMSGADGLQALQRTYHGAWMLFDSDGLQFDDGTGNAQWKFTLPLVPGDDPITARGSLVRWGKRFGDKMPGHVIFAAQVDNIVPSVQGANAWDLVLNDETLVLWTDADHYKTLGGVLNDVTLATLRTQSQLLGITE